MGGGILFIFSDYLCQFDYDKKSVKHIDNHSNIYENMNNINECHFFQNKIICGKLTTLMFPLAFNWRKSWPKHYQSTRFLFFQKLDIRYLYLYNTCMHYYESGYWEIWSTHHLDMPKQWVQNFFLFLFVKYLCTSDRNTYNPYARWYGMYHALS